MCGLPQEIWCYRTHGCQDFCPQTKESSVSQAYIQPSTESWAGGLAAFCFPLAKGTLRSMPFEFLLTFKTFGTASSARCVERCTRIDLPMDLPRLRHHHRVVGHHAKCLAKGLTPPSDDSSDHPGPWEQLHLHALLWWVFPTLNNAFGIPSGPMPPRVWLLARRSVLERQHRRFCRFYESGTVAFF
jgi:hypothetical protein